MADLEGTRSIEIAAPRERCFAIAADLDHVPEWHGAMTEVEVLERDDDGRGTLVQSELGRRLAILVRTVRGPVRGRVESHLTDRPVEGLKARAEAGS